MVPKGSNFSPPFPTRCFVFSDSGRPNGCEVIRHCGSMCIVLMISDAAHGLLSHLYIFFGEMTASPLPILKSDFFVFVRL